MNKSTDSLRSIRKAAGFTLDDLARRTGIPRSSIGAFEKGTRPLSEEAKTKIADFLGVEKSRISTTAPAENSTLSAIMPQTFREKIDAQWAAESTDQLKRMLQGKVELEDWGAVQLIARKLMDRDLAEFNEKLKTTPPGGTGE